MKRAGARASPVRAAGSSPRWVGHDRSPALSECVATRIRSGRVVMLTSVSRETSAWQAKPLAMSVWRVLPAASERLHVHCRTPAPEVSRETAVRDGDAVQLRFRPHRGSMKRLALGSKLRVHIPCCRMRAWTRELATACLNGRVCRETWCSKLPHGSARAPSPVDPSRIARGQGGPDDFAPPAASSGRWKRSP